MQIVARLLLMVGCVCLLGACQWGRAPENPVIAVPSSPPAAATVAVVGTLPPLPTRSPLQHPPSAPDNLLPQDRQVYEGRELPTALRDALQPWLDAERQRLNAMQTQPVITALIPQQVVIAAEWALVLLRQENRYTDRTTPETSTTALLSVRYLQRQVDTAAWQMVTQESVPGAVQAAPGHSKSASATVYQKHRTLLTRKRMYRV